MTQRVVIVGGGRVGSRAAAILDDYGHDPVVIERGEQRIDHLSKTTRGIVIEGDATRPDILRQADPARADVFAALTGNLETNRVLCDRVDASTDGVRTVARVEPSAPEPKARAVAGTGAETDTGTDAPDRTVAPAAAGAKAAADAILGYAHGLRETPDTGVDVVGIDVDPRAPAAHERLEAVSFPRGSHVVADTETMSVAGPRTELRPGRRYLVAVEPDAAAEVRTLLRG